MPLFRKGLPAHRREARVRYLDASFLLLAIQGKAIQEWDEARQSSAGLEGDQWAEAMEWPARTLVRRFQDIYDNHAPAGFDAPNIPEEATEEWKAHVFAYFSAKTWASMQVDAITEGDQMTLNALQQLQEQMDRFIAKAARETEKLMKLAGIDQAQKVLMLTTAERAAEDPAAMRRFGW